MLFLLAGGVDQTTRGASNTLYALLTHPDQMEAVRRDRSLIPQAIEGALRWGTPTLTMQRMVTQPPGLAGGKLPMGSILICNMGSANHDETRWVRPDDFDIFRERKTHIGFGYGPHTCLGLHLARMEISVMLNRLFDRLPDLRLD